MKYLKFRRSEGEFDWNYPFDFCGSLYTRESMVLVYNAIEDRQKLLKPNTFEYIGNVTIKKKMLAKDKQYCMCFNLPVMTVITVNKVQDIYSTPVYKLDTEENKGDEEEDVLQIMNDALINNREYDIDGYYAKTHFSAIHIGDFKLKPLKSEA